MMLDNTDLGNVDRVGRKAAAPRLLMAPSGEGMEDISIRSMARSADVVMNQRAVPPYDSENGQN